MSLSRKLRRRGACQRTVVLAAAITTLVLISWGSHSAHSERPTADLTAGTESPESGRTIFHREWLVNDPRSDAGDGLGPLFNESSCVACHNMGGAGGAGPVEKNVELLTASLFQNSVGPAAFVGDDGLMVATDAAQRELLAGIHPGFSDGDTVVLHRSGTDRVAHTFWQEQVRSGAMMLAQQPVFHAVQGFDNAPFSGPVPAPAQIQTVEGQFVDANLFVTEQFGVMTGGVDPTQFPVISRVLQRIAMLKQDVHTINETTVSAGTAVLQTSQRNTSPLFGIGLIDAIPEEVIEEIAAREHLEFPEVSGRVHRLEDGRIGRFGWKAQKATLYDFTMAACAVELGLHVPAHAQSEVPYDSEYEAPGLDLNQEQVEALVAYLRNLPPPTQNDPEDDEARERIGRGRELFETAGCAACHVEQVGDVDGLFSDLLLHDLGGELGAVGHYGVQPSLSPQSDEPLGLTDSGEPQRPPGPSATEWRTPPLWGCRDSGPYLHDGRAKTLETAIAFHGEEAAGSRLRFFMMPEDDQQTLIAFLKTLTAPGTDN